MRAKRLLAIGSIGATGVGVAVPGSAAVISGAGSTLAFVLAVLGAAIGIALVAGSVALYLSDVTTGHAVRVAGWNLLGIVVLGSVLALTVAHLDSFPQYVAAAILGVSAVAHVLIGVTDVRRIRVGELARQQELLAVLHRFVRHDLRHEAQVLIGLGSEIEHDEGSETGEAVAEVADRLTRMHENLGTIQRVIESDATPRAIPLRDFVERVAEESRAEYPDAGIETDVPGGLAVRATDDLDIAITELVENAVEHNDATPSVRVSAESVGGEVEIRVADDGPGIPERERAAVTGEREISQLDHATGLGLWAVRTIVESMDGELRFDDRSDGATVVVSLPAA